MTQTTGISESEFFMWRAVFAFAFVDKVLSLEEQELLRSYLATVPFSNAQRIILKEDLRDPKDVLPLYQKITDSENKKKFCVLARAIVWAEGDIDAQERAILKKVSCFKNADDEEILHGTRGHEHVQGYYEQYAKSGLSGLFRAPHQVELQA